MCQPCAFLNETKIGIVGCGHLGQAVAQMLVKNGLQKQNLLISHKGNPLTYQRLASLGLSQCLVANRDIFSSAYIVFLTVKPENLPALRKIMATSSAMIISCIAGVPTWLLRKVLGTDVYRIMFSGPDTILSGAGVAALYPECESVNRLIRAMRLRIVKTRSENDLDVFTAGVCLPAAILMSGKTAGQRCAIDRISAEFPVLSELYSWALKVLPPFKGEEEKAGYTAKMVTKGGITEAIIRSLKNGDPLDVALRKGIARTKEIAAETQQTIEREA